MDANASIDAWMIDICVPLAACTAGLLAGSLAVATLEAVLVGRLGRPTWRWSPAPRPLRRLAFAACGVGLVLAAPTIAAADPGPGPHPDPGARGVAGDGPDHGCPPLCTPGLDGLQLPDLPVSNLGGAGGAAPLPPVGREPIVVQPGDCLWTLAVDVVGAGAPDADVARAVQALIRLNRSAIGPDPDLIFPGTHLITPEVQR